MGSAPSGQDLVAVDVRDRHLGGGGEVQAVALDGVHLRLLVGDLAGAAGRVLVDEDRRPDLGVAALGRHVEEQTDERAHEARAGAGVQDEARAGDLGPALEVEQVQARADVPVRRPIPGRQRLAPRANDRVVLGAGAVGDLVARRVGDEEEVRLELRLHEGELRIQGRNPVTQRAERRLARLRLVGLAGADQLPHLLAARVPLVLGGIGRGQQLAPSPVVRQQSVDDLGAFSLAGDGRLDGVRIVADGLDRDHDASPAARSRSSTKGRSSEASSQPARGPGGSPQERSVQGGEGRPGRDPALLGRGEDGRLDALPHPFGRGQGREPVGQRGAIRALVRGQVRDRIRERRRAGPRPARRAGRRRPARHAPRASARPRSRARARRALTPSRR